MFGILGTVPATPEFQIQNNTVPPNIDPSTISFQSKLLLAPPPFFASNLLTTVGVTDTGETLAIGRVWSLDLSPVSPGLTTVEMVLIRLNTDFTPSGRFPVYLNESGTRIGYDAVVCVHKWEPWIVETSNTTTSPPSVLRIVAKGSGGTLLQPSGELKGHPITNTRHLNVTGKDSAFRTAYNNSFGQMLKDNGRSGRYIPSPTVGPIVPPGTTFLLTPTYLQAVSLTKGAGPLGYTELSPDLLAITRGRVSAANALPFLAGSGLVVAQQYNDETLAYATFKSRWMISLAAAIWFLGVIGELFVPALPFNTPRREFGMYSWLTLFKFQARGLVP